MAAVWGFNFSRRRRRGARFRATRFFLVPLSHSSSRQIPIQSLATRHRMATPPCAFAWIVVPQLTGGRFAMDADFVLRDFATVGDRPFSKRVGLKLAFHTERASMFHEFKLLSPGDRWCTLAILTLCLAVDGPFGFPSCPVPSHAPTTLHTCRGHSVSVLPSSSGALNPLVKSQIDWMTSALKLLKATALLCFLDQSSTWSWMCSLGTLVCIFPSSAAKQFLPPDDERGKGR